LEPTIRAVICPHCRNILFALEPDAKGGGAAWKITADSPAVQNDAQGNYMKCAKCAKRVAVEKVSAHGVESWKVAAAQK
jgi:hypothetical protein